MEEIKKRRGPKKDPKTGRFMKKEPVNMPPAPVYVDDLMQEPAPVGEYSRLPQWPEFSQLGHHPDRQPKKKSFLQRIFGRGGK